MKKYIAGITTGILLSCTVALAVNYTATENVFPIKLNGNAVSINGYNINGSTYFKLRDIADTVGGFDVDFKNNTIQLSKDGYVYENIQSNPNNDKVLMNYAQNNIYSVANKELETVYTRVKFLLADVTGDGVNDLLAVGLDDNNEMAQIEAYINNNGNVERIFNDHCQGYNGGYVLPVRYNENIYLCGFSYSSSTGFLKNLIKYETGMWKTAYSCYERYNYEADTSSYVVNDKIVSKDEYTKFADLITNSALTVDDFSDVDKTIQLPANSDNNIILSEDLKQILADYCMRIPPFNESDLTNEDFIDKFIFYFYTGKPTERQIPQGYAWKEEIVKAQFKLLFGQDMHHTDTRFESGYYNVPASNFGDEWYVFDKANHTKDGVDVVFKCTDSSNSFWGYKTCHIAPANNTNGYIITSINETTNN